MKVLLHRHLNGKLTFIQVLFSGLKPKGNENIDHLYQFCDTKSTYFDLIYRKSCRGTV